MGCNRNKERRCNGWFEVKGQKYYFIGNMAAVSSAQAKSFCAGQIQKDFDTTQFIDIDKFKDMTLDSKHNYLRQKCNKFIYITYEKMMESERKLEDAKKIVLEVFPPENYEILSLGSRHVKIKAKDSNFTRFETTRNGQHIYDWLLKEQKGQKEWEKTLEELENQNR